MTIKEIIFYWTPRILSLGFVLFLSLFAVDVFSEYSGFNVVLPLLIHLLPSMVLLVVALVAWNYELVGTIVFWAFAVFYVWEAGFNKPLTWYIMVVMPSFVIGFLYLMSWVNKRSGARIVNV